MLFLVSTCAGNPWAVTEHVSPRQFEAYIRAPSASFDMVDSLEAARERVEEMVPRTSKKAVVAFVFRAPSRTLLELDLGLDLPLWHRTVFGFGAVREADIVRGPRALRVDDSE